MTSKTEQATTTRSRSGWKVVGLIIFLIFALPVGLILWLIYGVTFPGEFEPVTLSQQEEQVLEQKLARIDPTRLQAAGDNQPPSKAPTPHDPETQSNAKVDNELTFTERELNALLAKYSSNAHLTAIDLSDNLINIRGLTPIDQHFPVIGGRTIEMIFTFGMSMDENRPALFFKTVTLWGMSIPETWFEDETNFEVGKVVDEKKGFWKVFSEKVENIAVIEDAVWIQLKE